MPHAAYLKRAPPLSRAPEQVRAGQVFNLALTDLPEKKTDLVTGSYTLPAPAGKTTVAVKIIDMLGGEVLVIAEV